jgi:pimeloyl-ACP methyl ester carboxylesterase
MFDARLRSADPRDQERSAVMFTFSAEALARTMAYAIASCAIALTCACDSSKDSSHNDPVVGQAGHLHIDDGGDGNGVPVVLIHSFGGNTTHWSGELSRLRPERRAIAIDLRGHGQSDAPESNDYAVELLASDIEAAVNALELEPFVLVGHSMGGSAAAEYAGSHPRRVAGLMLVGSPGKSDPAMAEQVMTSLAADYEGGMQQYTKGLLVDAKPAVAERIRRELPRIPREQSLAIIGAIFEHDPLPALRAYKGPILIVDTAHGDGPAALYKQMPEIPREVITGTSHWPHLDKPEAFAPLLDRLIAQAEAAR